MPPPSLAATAAALKIIGNQFANLYGLPHHKLFAPSRSPRCKGEFTYNIAIN
jgi:hypothetical protein